MAQSPIIKRIMEKAERLAQARKAIADYEQQAKAVLDPLKEERDRMQEELIKAMGEQELSSLKVSTGESFARVVKKGIKITSEIAAMKWARDNGAFSINRVMVAQKLKDVAEMPNGFERVESEYISVKKPKKDEGSK